LLDKNLICVTGLPRAGSTLLCQLLGLHPDIYSPGHSSPLNEAIRKLRHSISDSTFLAAQLDVNEQLVHQRLLNAFRGFVNGWFAEAEEPWVVDKNRGWLRTIELARLLDPDVRMIVCIRDLGQIFGSVEAAHRKTMLFEFPDHLDPDSPMVRANRLFGDGGIVGWPLRSMESLQDIQGQDLRQNLYYIAFEKLMEDPVDAMNKIYDWLGLGHLDWDPDDIPVQPGESDSHYRMKYRHRTYPSIRAPERHRISPRIENSFKQKFRWYYQQFYPHLLPRPVPQPGQGNPAQGGTQKA
jgi:sulfotransferase